MTIGKWASNYPSTLNPRSFDKLKKLNFFTDRTSNQGTRENNELIVELVDAYIKEEKYGME